MCADKVVRLDWREVAAANRSWPQSCRRFRQRSQKNGRTVKTLTAFSTREMEIRLRTRHFREVCLALFAWQVEQRIELNHSTDTAIHRPNWQENSNATFPQIFPIIENNKKSWAPKQRTQLLQFALRAAFLNQSRDRLTML